MADKKEKEKVYTTTNKRGYVFFAKKAPAKLINVGGVPTVRATEKSVMATVEYEEKFIVSIEAPKLGVTVKELSDSLAKAFINEPTLVYFDQLPKTIGEVKANKALEESQAQVSDLEKQLADMQAKLDKSGSK